MYMYNGILVTLKKELGSLTCSNKDKLLKVLYSGKYARHNRKNIAQYHLYELSRRKKKL